jgi:hypothetical protein
MRCPLLLIGSFVFLIWFNSSAAWAESAGACGKDLQEESASRPAASKPYSREAHWRTGQADELGDVPVQASRKAIARLYGLRSQLALVQTFVAGIPVGKNVSLSVPSLKARGISAGEWTALGPPNAGGRTRSIVIDPRTPDRMWAGSIAGGLWLSENGGGTWRPYDDRMASLAISTMAIDPSNPDKIFVGTGEAFTGMGIRGGGIFWTRNAGHSWESIAVSIPDLPDFEVKYVNRIAISHDGQTVLAATEDGLLKSDDPQRRNWTLRANSSPCWTVRIPATHFPN